MGWTSYHAKYYKNGSVDRKRECDSILDCETYSVLKSIMHGSVYYAAVQKIKRYLGNDENDEPMYESIPANSGGYSLSLSSQLSKTRNISISAIKTWMRLWNRFIMTVLKVSLNCCHLPMMNTL